MSLTTNIAWTDFTSSPWFGCTQVDPCCVNCYSMVMTLRYGWAGWGDNSPRVRSKGFWDNVRKWNATAGKAGVRKKIFMSLMDWLDPKAPTLWLAELLQVILECKNLDWLLLTKRPELFETRLSEALTGGTWTYTASLLIRAWLDGFPLQNVWFGYTAGTRKTWAERSAIVKSIPARIKWCSAEPLLERLETNPDPLANLDWIVIGGESGPGRRPGAGVEGIESLARQAKELNVATFVKQDFGAQPGKQGRISDEVWAWKEFPATR